MRLRLRRSNRLLLSLISFLLLIFAFSCGERERYVGKYLVQTKESPKYSETYIELMENGQGIWGTLDDEVSFTWYVKGNEVRLNTKLGGVIVGKIKDDTLEIELPGAKLMSFRKVK